MKELTLFNIPLFYIFIVIAFILPKIPIIGKFFNIINTVIHEFGHAFFTLILEGKVHKIEIFSDSAGSTVTQSKSKWSNILIALAGYSMASSIAYFCFYLLKYEYELGLVIGLSILFFIMLIFWIRNWYGFFWVLIFCGINLFLIYYYPSYLKIAALFYATMILVESISSTFVLLYFSIKQSDDAGDATNLQRFTHIPAFIWALLFTAYACFIGYCTIVEFILPNHAIITFFT
ncbi:MAG: M50 family metallopeptidase [Bacteroidales bacterium]